MVSNLTVKVGADIAGLQKELQKVTKELSGFSGGMQTIGKTIAGAFAVSQLIQFGKEIINVAAKYQKFQAVLQNTLGSRSAALTAMEDIKEFAAKTPFQVDELTSSFVKLVNQGFKPTMDQIRSLGDLAASQGKSFDQLTEAIIDGQTGEFERLKEFGIRAKKEGDKVTFTFKGVKQQVDFTGDSIRKYILSLGNAAGVSGSMASVSTTLGGKISNLGDNLDQLASSIGSRSGGLVGAFLDLANNALGALNNSLNDQVSALQNEQTELNVLVGAITDVNVPTEVRSRLIEELNQKYPDFLKNLNAEKITNEQLTKRLSEVNDQFFRKIALVAAEERFKSVQEDILDLIDREVKARKDLSRIKSGETTFRDDARSEGLNATQKQLQETDRLEKLIFDTQQERTSLQADLNSKLTSYNEALNIFKSNGEDYFEVTNKNIQATDAFAEAIARVKGKIKFNSNTDMPGALSTQDFQNNDINLTDDSEINNAFRDSIIADAEALFGLSDALQGATISMDGYNEKQKSAKSAMDATSATAQQMGTMIGGAFSEAIGGQDKFADAMRRIVPQLLGQFLALALGGTIAGAGKTGAPPPVIVALAAAGVAAVGTMFKAATGFSRGGGGGGTSGSGSTTANSFMSSSSGMQVELGGMFRVQGEDLVLALDNYNRKKGRTG